MVAAGPPNPKRCVLMANQNIPNEVAQNVAAALDAQTAKHRGALALRGYLWIAAEGGTERRLYIEDSFRVYLEFNATDILHHIPGVPDAWSPMGTVWIKRETPIKLVQEGYAYAVVEAMSIQDDPAGGPTPPWRGPTPPWRGPTPPWSGPTPPFT